MRKTIALVMSAGIGLSVLAGAALADKGQGMFGRADTNGDQRLSRDEAKQVPSLAQHFDRLDTDKDGSLTLAEFGKGMAAK